MLLNQSTSLEPHGQIYEAPAHQPNQIQNGNVTGTESVFLVAVATRAPEKGLGLQPRIEQRPGAQSHGHDFSSRPL